MDRLEKLLKPLMFGLDAPRLGVLSRITAAVLGGYALANVLPVMLFSVWPMMRSDAALWAIQLSFLVFACAIIWVFSARTAGLAWLGLLAPSVVCGLLAWWWL